MPRTCLWRIKNGKENIVSYLCDEISGCIDHTNWIGYSSFSIEFNIRDIKHVQKRGLSKQTGIFLKESLQTKYWLELMFEKRSCQKKI